MASTTSLPDLEQLVAIVTQAACEEILPRFQQVASHLKSDGSLLTEADLATQQRITTELARQWPDIPLLGEEMAVAEQEALIAHSEHGLWVLDPLDGTTNFAAGLPYFAVSLAYLEEGEAKLGLVYDPMRDECFTAIRDSGARLNGEALRLYSSITELSQAVALVDFKRLSPELSTRLVVDTPYRSQRSFGAGALDWCWVALERCHVYLHGKQKLWDYAAGSLIFTEAGGYLSTLSGEPLPRGKTEAQAVMGAVNNELFELWQAWIHQI